MTSTASTYRNETSAAPSRTPLLVTLSLASAAVLTAVGTFLDLTGNEPNKDNGPSDLGPWAVCIAISAVTALIAFGLVVRGAAQGNAGRRALITSVVGVLSVAVFWTGIPSVLVAASVGCALIDRDQHGSFGGMSKAGLAISAVVAGLAVFAAIAG